MEWNNTYLNKFKFNSYTSWFLIYDFTEFKDDCGVFVFANSAHQVKYIDYAKRGVLIDSIANSIVDGKDQYSNLVMAIYTKTVEEAIILSNYLIERYKPVNNLENREKIRIQEPPQYI
jgi:hypothetical protein